MPTTSSQEIVGPEILHGSAQAALENDPAWLSATAAERAVLKRIAAQRDRLCSAKKTQQVHSNTLRAPASTVPAEAPFAQRLAVFVKLHPVATASVAGLALLLGPRKLIRFSSIAIPLISKLKR